MRRLISASLYVGMMLGSMRAMAQPPAVGTISGTVTDADGHAPVNDVTVLIVGTNRAGRTDAEGHYRIGGAPSGAQQVRAYRLGYTALVQPVTVSAGATTTLDFGLHATSTTLAQVVITGTSVQAQQARENGASIGVIPLDSINPAPITDFSELLEARVPSVVVQQLSGTIGTASKIVVRGEGTLSLVDQPLIVIDGVRAYNDINGLADIGGLGGQSISRFDDLDRESIEQVQVLKGAAAAALYGTEAAAGVIVIQTRHGEVAQAPVWHVFGSLGSVRNVTEFPANWGRGDPTNPSASCSLIQQMQALCNAGPLNSSRAYSYNLVEHSPTFFPGYDEGTGASVSGGSPTTTYYVGANWKRTQGVYHDNEDRSTHLTGAFTLHPYSILDFSVNAQYTQRRTLVPFGDNFIGGVLTSDLLGGPGKGLYFAGQDPRLVEQIPDNSNVDRFTVGSNGTLRVLPWLTVHGTVGVDFLDIYDNTVLDQTVLPPIVTSTGGATAANNSIFQYTGSTSAVAAYQLGPTIRATTTFGGEWEDFSLRQALASGQEILPGTQSVAGATNNFSATEVNQDIVDIGGFVQQTFSWRDVLYVTGAARLDGNSAFGSKASTALFPSASLSYVVSDERFWSKNDYLSSLRFRVAGGQTGVEPSFRQALGSFIAGSYNVLDHGSQIALLPNTYGAANLKPERSTEFEGGFDLGLAKERLTLTVTAYDKTERNLVQQIPVDISTGVGGANAVPSFVYSNLGLIDNRGLEIGLSGNVFRTPAVAFDFSTNFTLARNKVTNLGSPNAALITIGSTQNPLQLDSTGFPIGGYFAQPYTYQDKNHDGRIEPSEITYGSKPVYVGESGPREQITISPTVMFFKYLKVNALFDRRDGLTVYDGTDAFRCLGTFFQEGRECNDPKAPLKDQAAMIAENGELFGLPQSDYGYLGNGSFWKWREVSFTLTTPDNWNRRLLFGHSAQLTFSGRNLATWTNYRGIDPEVNRFGGGFNPSANQQFFEQPPLRFWIGRVDISW